MQNKITKRLAQLRHFLEEKDLHAFIIPSTDAHLSEYPANHWASREWISGFTGSAGTVVVTRENAGLWTDSRYFLQAAQELQDTGIELFKERLPMTPTIDEWLIAELSEGDNVGIDGNVYSAKDAFALIHKLNQNGLHVIADYDPFQEIWKDRPDIPLNPIFPLPVEYAGVSVAEKIKMICDSLDKEGADGLLVASLDTVAWIFNIRGNDVKCNPVAVSYAYVSKEETVLFIDPRKMSEEIASDLQKQGVRLADYTKVGEYVSRIQDKVICLTGNKISFSLYNKISPSCRIVDTLSPADLLKSIKNETEIQGFRNAMERDGVALVRFYRWLEVTIPQGNVTEVTVAEKLSEFRAMSSMYVGDSFDTIAGYQGNGAVVHYHAVPESAQTIQPEGVLLIDSGAQYFDGTTDITRTWAVGPVTEDAKRDYTLVLKGHIALAMAIYPQGTRGSQLDILARKELWDNGINYLHGTGHGIGHFLNVHEGPQGIRMEENPVTLQIGMITSNEPGLYRANKYGIRIENLILTKHKETTEFGEFYDFETLTLCHIDTTLIVKDMLTEKEISWLNNYHQRVYDRLSPSLNEEEKEWLKIKTKEI